jgi:metal-responsive CopG/Arc/MetJ family transcriptional regulator
MYIRSPNGKPRSFVALRLQKNVIRLVDDIANKENSSRSEVIRSLIGEKIKSVLTKGRSEGKRIDSGSP